MDEEEKKTKNQLEKEEIKKASQTGNTQNWSHDRHTENHIGNKGIHKTEVT